MPLINKINLTEKQYKFCQEYLRNGGNATQAYRDSYNTSDMSDKTIRQKASALLNKDHIRATIDYLRKPQEVEYTLDKKQRIKIVEDIANSKEEKSPDRLKAIDILLKLHGDFKEDNTQKNANFTDLYDLGKLDTDEKAMLLKLLNKAKK